MPQPSPDPVSILEEQLPSIDRILRGIRRRRGLGEEEGDEFRSFVYQRLLAKDCAILRKFRGGSSWPTYLTVVLQRLFLDFREHRWGKWRPPVQARRRGEAGVLLARLVRRDGFGVEEAVRILRANHRVRVPADELRQWAAELPLQGRPRQVGEDGLRSCAAGESVEEALQAKENESAGEKVYRSLGRVLKELPAEDRLLVKMRYLEGFRVSEIARTLGRPQRALYRECEAILRRMKRSLVKAGCRPEEVAEVLADS